MLLDRLFTDVQNVQNVSSSGKSTRKSTKIALESSGHSVTSTARTSFHLKAWTLVTWLKMAEDNKIESPRKQVKQRFSVAGVILVFVVSMAKFLSITWLLADLRVKTWARNVSGVLWCVQFSALGVFGWVLISNLHAHFKINMKITFELKLILIHGKRNVKEKIY